MVITCQETRRQLVTAVTAGLNVLIEGRHGTGKSSLVLSVAAELGVRLKYYSASTLDPFADLVGIPVPVCRPDGHREIVFCRPTDVNEAELIFFDELNRAHPKTLNAVYELIQFRSLNGTKLPHLHCVIGAINPPDGAYQVQNLDPALVDRFHLCLSLQSQPDEKWFRAELGEKLGLALVAWYQTDLAVDQQTLVSPRRLEYIGRVIQAGLDPCHTMPPACKLPFHLLALRLKESEAVVSIEDFIRQPDKFAETVAKDLNVAIRFAQLLPMMNPTAKNRVKSILLALPDEVLAQLLAQHPFVFPATSKAIRLQESAEQARLFEARLEERLRPIRTQLAA